MSLSPNEIWTRLLNQARQELPEQTFRSWLEPTEALEVVGSTIFVGAPDQFAADWNDSKHADMLSSLAPIALGHPMTVVFRVNDERKSRSQMDLFVSLPDKSTAQIRGQDATTAPLNTRYTFDHFVIGKSNEMAAAAAQAIAEAPGRTYNPLFLYGDTGLGKTHLMQAVAHHIIEQKPETRLVFIGAEQFTNELIAAIHGRTTPDFRRRYRETDLLLVDDVQFLKNKEATQEEFFHTFNALYEAGRQIVLTSDRPPTEIPGLEARLVSRFAWGMVADIELPDLEHRIAILQHKARLDHLELTIPEDVIRFVAENVRSNVRELEGSMIKLLAYASLKRQDISIELARSALRDKLGMTDSNGPESSRSLSLSAIQHAVAKEWGVTVEMLKSKTRTRQITTPRQIAMFLSRELLGLQLVEIGNAFGGRDHSTVIHSLERVHSVLVEDPITKNRILRLRTLLETMRI